MRHTVSVEGDASDEIRRLVGLLEAGDPSLVLDASHESARQEAEDRLGKALVAWRHANPTARLPVKPLCDTIHCRTDSANETLKELSTPGMTYSREDFDNGMTLLAIKY